jgi:alpha-glucosidase
MFFTYLRRELRRRKKAAIVISMGLALRLRQELPGLGDGSLEWLDAPEGFLCFGRPGFVCTVNLLGDEAEVPAPGRPLLASAPVTVDDGLVRIPADSCVWWAV